MRAMPATQVNRIRFKKGDSDLHVASQVATWHQRCWRGSPSAGFLLRPAAAHTRQPKYPAI